MANEKRICVDFDGVIHKYSEGWKGGMMYDSPVEGAASAINRLISEGFEIIILTARDKTHFPGIFKYLKDCGVEEEFLKTISVGNVKVPAIAYIDDRGIRFTNWEDMIKYFL